MSTHVLLTLRHTVYITQPNPIPQTCLTIPVGITPEALLNAVGQAELVAMRQCPKFDSCSAPVCPLDPHWKDRSMEVSDRTCTWLREEVKAGPMALCIPENIRAKVAAALPVLLSSVGMASLRGALKRAAKSPSKRGPCALLQLRPMVTA